LPGDVEKAVKDGVSPLPQRADVSQLNDRMSAINEKLAGLTATMEFLKPDVSRSLPKAMKQSLQQKGDLELGLKTLAALATKAQEKRITTDREAIKEVSRDLLSVKERNADFWKAYTSLLNYRSFNVSPSQTAALSIANLPNCTDSDPVPIKITAVSPTGQLTGVSNAYYENCRLTLDSAEDGRRINSMVLKQFPTIEFRHCLIVYKGGGFTLITYWDHFEAPAKGGSGTGAVIGYTGPTMQFIECSFDFSVSNPMPKAGQEITQNLLAQTGLSLSLPLGKTSPSVPPTHN
jgi:hypothetical protein